MLSNYGVVQKFFKALTFNGLPLTVFSVLLCVEPGAEIFVEIIPQKFRDGLS
jgi:hypothetical protein